MSKPKYPEITDEAIVAELQDARVWMTAWSVAQCFGYDDGRIVINKLTRLAAEGVIELHPANHYNERDHYRCLPPGSRPKGATS